MQIISHSKQYKPDFSKSQGIMGRAIGETEKTYEEAITKAFLQSRMINFAMPERFEFRLKLAKRKRNVTNVLRERVP